MLVVLGMLRTFCKLSNLSAIVLTEVKVVLS